MCYHKVRTVSYVEILEHVILKTTVNILNLVLNKRIFKKGIILKRFNQIALVRKHAAIKV